MAAVTNVGDSSPMLTRPEREQRSEPLSPELVLVSPDLREIALRQLAAEPTRDRPTHWLETFDREAADDVGPKDTPREGLLRALTRATLRSAASAALAFGVVAGVATVLTLSGERGEPRLLDGREPQKSVERTDPATTRRTAAARLGGQGIGVAAAHGVPPPHRRAALTDGSRTAPRAITAYGRLVWNLDALVRDRFGNHPVCLSFARNRLSPSACAESAHQRTLYRATFAAVRSDFHSTKLERAPHLRTGAVPLKVGAAYISCGPRHWLAASANWTLVCEAARPAP
jgi:hypothetical protein